jgi:Skp family chaperone for outer membrane proteins
VDKRKQFDDLVARRDKAAETIQRIQGRLDAAKRDLATIEAECVKKGVKPEQLDAAIQQLNSRLDKAVSEFADKVQKVEQSIKPFLQE